MRSGYRMQDREIEIERERATAQYKNKNEIHTVGQLEHSLGRPVVRSCSDAEGFCASFSHTLPSRQLPTSAWSLGWILHSTSAQVNTHPPHASLGCHWDDHPAAGLRTCVAFAQDL